MDGARGSQRRAPPIGPLDPFWTFSFPANLRDSTLGHRHASRAKGHELPVIEGNDVEA